MIAKPIVGANIKGLVSKSSPHYWPCFDELFKHFGIMIERRAQKYSKVGVQEIHHSFHHFFSVSRAYMCLKSVPVEFAPLHVRAFFTDTDKEIVKFPIMIQF